MTRGVAALGTDLAERILHAVMLHESFTDDSDPYREHDFGSVNVGEHTAFFKIEYFALDMLHGSPDPSDPSVTERVLTIMLAEEY